MLYPELVDVRNLFVQEYQSHLPDQIVDKTLIHDSFLAGFMRGCDYTYKVQQNRWSFGRQPSKSLLALKIALEQAKDLLKKKDKLSLRDYSIDLGDVCGTFTLSCYLMADKRLDIQLRLDEHNAYESYSKKLFSALSVLMHHKHHRLIARSIEIIRQVNKNFCDADLNHLLLRLENDALRL